MRNTLNDAISRLPTVKRDIAQSTSDSLNEDLCDFEYDLFGGKTVEELRSIYVRVAALMYYAREGLSEARASVYTNPEKPYDSAAN